MEEDWLRHFLRQAIVRKTPLTRVVIMFDSDHGWGFWENTTNRLEKLKHEFQPYGMAVEYNKPLLTPNECFSWY